MMSSLLINNIQKLLADSPMSVKEFERRAGLKQCAVNNIISGKSNKPSAETVFLIAQELGCSVEELFTSASISSHDSQKNQEKNIKLYSTQQFNQQLFNEIFTFITNFVEKNNCNILFWEALAGISEIYQYSYEQNNQQLDARFADWWLTRNLHLT